MSIDPKFVAFCDRAPAVHLWRPVTSGAIPRVRIGDALRGAQHVLQREGGGIEAATVRAWQMVRQFAPEEQAADIAAVLGQVAQYLQEESGSEHCFCHIRGLAPQPQGRAR